MLGRHWQYPNKEVHSLPSLVSHHHFAVMVEHAAEPDLARACHMSPIAYRWGAQGPDILFYHNAPFGSRTVLLGHRMHREHISTAFLTLVRAAARLRDSAALSYVLGFCTHYCLDRRTHPYIQDTIETLLMPRYQYDEEACHRLCEADLDAAVIEHYISAEQERFEAFRLLDPQTAVCRQIGKMLTEVGLQVFNIQTAPAKVESSMRTMRTVHTLLHGSSESTRAQIRSVEKLIGKPGLLSTMLRPLQPLPEDCVNLSHRAWHKPHVPEVTRYESFFDLMEDAIPAALSLQRAVFTAYHRGTALNPLFFPADYNGKPIIEEVL